VLPQWSRMRAKEKTKPVSGARLSPVREKRPLGLDDRELVESALALLERIVTVEAAAILRRPISDIDPLRPLSEIGMDSLMAVELRLALESRLGVDVPLFPLAEDVAWIASRIEAATEALVEQGMVPFRSALDFLLQRSAERAQQKNELAQVIPGATVDDMDTAAAIAAAARTLLGNGVKDLPDSVLGDLWRVVAAEVEARETGRASEESRPEIPAPSAAQAVEAAARETTEHRAKWKPDLGLTAAQFAAQAYAPEIGNGTFDKSLVRREDRTLYRLLFREKAWGELAALTETPIPTKSERRLAEQIEAVRAMGLPVEEVERTVAGIKEARALANRLAQKLPLG
jgi:acyl carrier protein